MGGQKSVRSAGQGSARVFDPVRFAAAIRALVREFHGGSLSEASRKAEIPRQTLTRWAKLDAVVPTTAQFWVASVPLQSLNKHLSLLQSSALKRDRLRAVAIQRELRSSFLASRTADASRQYRRWLQRRLLEFDLVAEQEPEKGYGQEALIHSMAFEDMEDLIDNDWCLGALDSFREKMRARGHEEPRIQLAVRRILEPLLDARLTGSIERAVTQYSPRSKRIATELRRFIAHGISRETFMLDRKPAGTLQITASQWKAVAGDDLPSSKNH